MKKCPGCGSIDTDDSSKCGVCGHDLRGIPSGPGIEKVPIQEQQAKAPAKTRKNADRSVIIIAILLMASGTLLFIYQKQTWLIVLSATLFLIGFVLLALEGIGGGEKEEPKNLPPGWPPHPGLPPPGH